MSTLTDITCLWHTTSVGCTDSIANDKKTVYGSISFAVRCVESIRGRGRPVSLLTKDVRIYYRLTMRSHADSPHPHSSWMGRTRPFKSLGHDKTVSNRSRVQNRVYGSTVMGGRNLGKHDPSCGKSHAGHVMMTHGSDAVGYGPELYRRTGHVRRVLRHCDACSSSVVNFRYSSHRDISAYFSGLLHAFLPFCMSHVQTCWSLTADPLSRG